MLVSNDLAHSHSIWDTQSKETKNTEVKCHVLYPQRHPKRKKVKPKAIVPSVAFQEETKPYGTRNYTPPS